MQLYRYIGPKRITARIRSELAGMPIHSPDDVRAWVRDTAQELCDGNVIATFVIDVAGILLIADRRSEHVVCAGGQSVQSAGEITFHIKEKVEVDGVSNQSTGYCPEPESWLAVSEALSRAGLVVPNGFSLACVFRRCVGCGSLAIVKDGVFECGVCGSELPATYNVQE